MPTVVVRLNVKPEKEGEFLEIFQEVSKIVKEKEHECTIYAVWETDTPHEYYHIASYKSQAGRDYHTELHIDSIGPRFLPCLSQDPRVKELGPQIVG